MQNFMRKYWKNSFKLSVLALIALSMGFGSCTKTDDRVGNESFIPDASTFTTYRMTDMVGDFEIETIYIDSVSSSNLSYGYIGSKITAREGLIEFAYVGQTYPSGDMDTDTDYPFGEVVNVDSAFFSLSVVSYSGDAGRDYVVSVYELKQPLPYGVDSVYFSNFDIEPYIDSEPIFTIDAVLGEQIYTEIPTDYAEKLLSYTSEDYEEIDSFHNKFYGYYITTSYNQNDDIVNMFDQSASGFTVFYHNENEDADTTYMDFIMGKEYSTTETYYYYYTYTTTYDINVGFNTIKRDYSLKDPIFGIDFEEGVTSDKSYASGYAGVLTRLTIPQDIIDQLKEEVAAKGGTKIAVTSATMVVPCGDTTVTGMAASLASLGMYQSYQPTYNVSTYDEDTYEYYDANYVSPDYSLVNGTTSYSVTLNRSEGTYTFNIPTTIQGLVNGTLDNNVIEIAPSYDAKESSGVSVFENSADRPITMNITYIVL